MNNVASPGHVVHRLLSEHGVERLQDAVAGEVEATGQVDWPEPWDAVGYTECWLCPECKRLYVGLDGPHEAVRVYAPETIGIDPQDTWSDMYILPTGQIWLGPTSAEPGAAPDPAT
ncbi:MAG TPA: hypothetical protein VGE74_25135 [Gemmata sp.]